MLVHLCVFWFCLLLVFFLQILLFLMFGWGRYSQVVLVVEVFQGERERGKWLPFPLATHGWLMHSGVAVVGERFQH